jgi:hypothetical protein
MLRHFQYHRVIAVLYLYRVVQRRQLVLEPDVQYRAYDL